MSTQTDVQPDIFDTLISDRRCDYELCENVASHMGLCPQCTSFEYFCTPHTESIRNSPPDMRGTFTHSCGHHVFNRDITFVTIR